MAINITILIIVSSVSLLGLILFYLVLFKNLAIYHKWRHHVQCILTVPFGNSFKIVKVKWVIQTMQTFDDKSGKRHHTYNLNLDKAIFGKGNNPILYYNINYTEPINISKSNDRGKSSNIYHTILKDRSAEEALSKNQNKSMLLIIMILVVIIAGVGIFAQYQLSQANDKIIVLTKYIAEVMANATKTGGIIVK